ncbi:MAG: hypothetical protein C0518_05905 [Opitutus sp.]|nr:hypothetical protein [Opitutus sp.]
MKEHTYPRPVATRFRALRLLAGYTLAVLTTITASADVVFSRNTTTGEPWAQYSATFTATFTGPHTLAFTQTAGGPSGDNSILIDKVMVKVVSTGAEVFADGFETPAIATNAGISSNTGTATIGNWICTYSAGILDGSPPNWGLSGQGLGTADGTTQYGFLQAYGGGLSSIKTATSLSLVAGQTYSVSFYQASRRDFGGTTTYNVSFDFVPPTVYASGLSDVIAWDPIFPSGPVSPDSLESTPTPSVGYNDPRWANPHAASVFARNSHPWEYEGWVPSTFKFDASWINAWGNLSSNGHGKGVYWTNWVYNYWWGWYQSSTPAYQSWTKYSTIVHGSGSFVLQFFADNASWIYLNGELVGYQDYNWPTNGTGRYTIQLDGNGPHELSWIIWDGGGAAGGKFRLETTQSFTNNNPGVPLPPPPPASDTTAPVIVAPSDIVAEATGPDGAAVTFSATATDNKDGSVPVVAAPASGSTFPLGTTAVGLAASDTAGNTASAEFDITVRDTTPPAIDIATNVGPVEATGPSGAVVTFASPSATDLVDGSVAVNASPTSGSMFAIGSSTVTLAASDSRGNASSRTFNVTVADTTAPSISAPADIVAEATSGAGAAVSYSASATDLVDGSVAASGSPASGSTFPLGTTSVALSSADSRGNTSSASFAVTVRDTIAPTLNVPASQTLEATSPAGASASFAASATDAVGVASLTYSQGSGSTFSLGTTPVTVTARDAAGNTSSGTFSINVVDTTAPLLTVPANQVLEATSAAGAVANFAASATDIVGVTSLTSSAASGATFPIGTTTVTVTAQDAAGNTTSGSFTILVRDTTAPVISSLSNSAPTLWPPNHKMVNVTVSPIVTDIVGVTSLKIVRVTSSEPDNGLGDGDTANDIAITGNLTVQLRAERSGSGNGRTYTITVEARDAAGNASTRTTTAFVPKSQGK